MVSTSDSCVCSSPLLPCSLQALEPGAELQTELSELLEESEELDEEELDEEDEDESLSHSSSLSYSSSLSLEMSKYSQREPPESDDSEEVGLLTADVALASCLMRAQ